MLYIKKANYIDVNESLNYVQIIGIYLKKKTISAFFLC